MKTIILCFLGLSLLFASPDIWAQEPRWPWSFEGGNFQITNNLQDDYLPSIVSAPQNNPYFYLVVWVRKTPSGFDIYGARVTKDGRVFEEEDEGGIPICIAPNDQMFPSVSWDGENFFVVWQDRRSGKRWDIYGARVAPEGKVLDPDGFPIAVGKLTYDQVSPALSFDGENYLVVWQGKRSSKTWNIYFTRVSKGGEILDGKPVPLNPSLRDQASPAVDFDGEDYMIVWQDKRGGKYWDIYGARVTPSGGVLDTKGIPISPIFKENVYRWDKWRPILSWDGNFFLLIWMASREEEKRWYLEGRRLSVQGEWVDLLDIPIQMDTTSKAFPALLWGGDQYILVWEEEPEGQSKISGAFILPQYKPFTVSEAVLISFLDAKDPAVPAVSRIGSEMLVVWQGMGHNGYWQIYGQRLKKQLVTPSNSLGFTD